MPVNILIDLSVKQKECNVVLGLHMILCYYALGEKDQMKRGFQMLLDCPLNIDDDEKYNATSVSTKNIWSCVSVTCLFAVIGASLEIFHIQFGPVTKFVCKLLVLGLSQK